jgi:hypothetical protein
MSLAYFFDIIPGPGVDSAGAWVLQSYHRHVPIVSKSGGLNFLEPSGSVIGLYGRLISVIKNESSVKIPFVLHRERVSSVI